MKKYISLFLILLVFPFFAVAQEDVKTDEETKEAVSEEDAKKLERPAFESSFIVDNPTDVVYQKNTLEAQMYHRFGIIDGNNDLAGIWGAANIKLGVTYSLTDRLTVGVGTTKNHRLYDFNAKYALLRQTKSGKMPINLTYYGNFTYDGRDQENTNFNYDQDRFSYFNMIIISRRFSPNFSMQVAPSISHYNLVEADMENDMFAVALGARYKISPQTAILVDYSQPLSNFESDPEPGLSLGLEFATSAHAFQIFVSNYWGIIPQENYMWNQNDFFGGDVLLGFNITRIYNF